MLEAQKQVTRCLRSTLQSQRHKQTWGGQRLRGESVAQTSHPWGHQSAMVTGEGGGARACAHSHICYYSHGRLQIYCLFTPQLCVTSTSIIKVRSSLRLLKHRNIFCNSSLQKMFLFEGLKKASKSNFCEELRDKQSRTDKEGCSSPPTCRGQ